MFTYLKKRRERKERAKALYEAAVAQARLPAFYEEMGVPDTVDGRFEMIALHCYILMRRLQVAGERALSQKLFDTFFVMMDRSLREMGVGDLAVPKHMKRMMQGFNGRADQYEKALKEDDQEMLKQALIRNVYGTIEKPSDKHLTGLIYYVQDSAMLETLEPVFASLNNQEKRRA